MSTLQEAKKWNTAVSKKKNREANKKVLVKKITHQNRKTKALVAKTVTKKVCMMKRKPCKNKDTEFY